MQHLLLLMAQLGALLVISLLAATPGCLARHTPINTGQCRLHTLHNRLSKQHVRFFYWELPWQMQEEWRAYCGTKHMAPWDGVILESNPLGLHMPWWNSQYHKLAMHDHALSCTFGRMHATNQFAAPIYWRHQAQLSPLRVDKVEDADVVLVDLVDEYCMSSGAKFQKNKSWAKKWTDKAMSLMYEHVNKTDKPHIVPLARPELWYWGQLTCPNLLGQPEARNVTWISTELTDWPHAKVGPRHAGLTPEDYYVVPMPYPSTLHYTTHDPYFAMLHNLHKPPEEKTPPMTSSYSTRRTLSAPPLDLSFTPRATTKAADSKPQPPSQPPEKPKPKPKPPASPPTGPTFPLMHPPHSSLPCYLTRKTLLVTSSYDSRLPIRRALTKQCKAAGVEKCVHYEVKRDTFFPTLPLIQEALGRAWFCFVPYGDTHTRRAFVDCLMQDSIPVIFSNWTMQTVPYFDILDPTEFVVNLPDFKASLEQLGTDPKKRKKDVPILKEAEDILGYLEKHYPIEVRTKMVQHIFKIKHMFQPMIDPVHELIRWDQLNSVHCLDDAFTSTFKAALRSMCRRGLLPAYRCSQQGE